MMVYLLLFLAMLKALGVLPFSAAYIVLSDNLAS